MESPGSTLFSTPPRDFKKAYASKDNSQRLPLSNAQLQTNRERESPDPIQEFRTAPPPPTNLVPHEPERWCSTSLEPVFVAWCQHATRSAMQKPCHPLSSHVIPAGLAGIGRTTRHTPARPLPSFSHNLPYNTAPNILGSWGYTNLSTTLRQPFSEGYIDGVSTLSLWHNRCCWTGNTQQKLQHSHMTLKH